MPHIFGKRTTDPNETIGHSLCVSEAIFDPPTRERPSGADRRRVSRPNAADALQRRDMEEYWAQSILASQSRTDALEYARQWLGQTPIAARPTIGLVIVTARSLSRVVPATRLPTTT
jgi:hypothetical protein